jgi:YesN/AraC family two-component response regulator
LTTKLKRTVLIVDDEATIRTYLQLVLRREGFETVEATNGVEALEVMRRFKVDILISDVQMPKMDGIGLANAVRAEFPDTPLILISGYADTEQIRNMKVIFLQKPLRLPALWSSIEQVTMTKKEPGSETEHGPGSERTRNVGR